MTEPDFSKKPPVVPLSAADQQKKFWLPIHVDPGVAVIGVSFVNDLNDPTTSQDRNVYVNKIKLHVER